MTSCLPVLIRPGCTTVNRDDNSAPSRSTASIAADTDCSAVALAGNRNSTIAPEWRKCSRMNDFSEVGVTRSARSALRCCSEASTLLCRRYAGETSADPSHGRRVRADRSALTHCEVAAAHRRPNRSCSRICTPGLRNRQKDTYPRARSFQPRRRICVPGLSSRARRGLRIEQVAIPKHPSASFRRISSTLIRVPLMTGFPIVTFGSISMRSVVMALFLTDDTV